VNTLDELIGESAPMVAVRESVQRLLGRRSEARRMPPVLLLGETGTGKGLLAKLLHRGSSRHIAPLIEVNCAAIPETMLEAELFGYERGAFTDARGAKPGLLQAAQGGSLFLDEIGLLSLTLQSKLLKAIEEQSVRRLGSTRAEPIDVWIISATSDDLVAKCRDGRFREDLYHRVAVLTFSMPPLRDRSIDIVRLAERFLAEACRDYGLPRKRLNAAAESALRAYSWPGNVRQLANVMERVVLLFDGPVVSAETLAIPQGVVRGEPADDDPEEAAGPVAERRRAELLAALQATDWNITHTARRLMLSRNTVKARMRRCGLSADRTLAAEGVPVAAERPAPGLAVEGKPNGVVWEIRRLTVLRAEVATAEGAAPWGVDRAFGAIVEKVAMFGGRVEDVSPRAAMAVFGLDAIDDAARRAANAALAIIRMLRERDGVTVTLAIHAAELLVARLSGGTAIDVNSKRDASAALEALGRQSSAGQVIVSGAAARLLSRRFELAPVAGLSHHVSPVFQLAGRERSGFVPFADGGNFVERHYDLEMAQRRLGMVEGGQGQVLAIVGEPGIGKSRLLYEFRRTLGNRGCRVLDAYCPSHGGAFPFLPIVDIVRALFDLGDADDARTVREAVSQASQRFGPALAGDNLPAALALLDALPVHDPLRLLTPIQRRQRVEEAVCQLVLAESARQPLVIAVEDLQWIDSDSKAVLDALVDRLSRAPVMLLVTQRPLYTSGWSRKAFYEQVTLEPLMPSSVRTVLDELLGQDDTLRSLKDAIVGRTEGNPFFVEETVRTLVESGTVVGQPGAYVSTARTDAIQVPPTVQAVLAERIDRLSVEDKRLLQAAVVVGDGGSSEILARVAEVPVSSFRAALERLHRAQFLYEAGREHQTIAFRHSLVQEVGYASLTATHRRALHQRCLAVLEGAAGAAPEDAVEEAAHHAFHAESWDRASRYARRAAAKAMGRSAYRAAVSALSRALVALDKLPPTRETLAQSIDARIDLRNMLWALSELSQGLEVLQDAVPLAEALGDQRRLARVFAHMSSNLVVLGDNERAQAAGQQAAALANTLDDVAVRIDCNQLLGMLHHSLGDYHEASRFLEGVIAELAARNRAGRFGAYYAVHSRTWLAWALMETGDVDRAANLAQEAVAVAEASGEVHNLVPATWGCGLVEMARGAVDRAIPMLRRAQDIAKSAEMALWSRPTAAVLGRALVLAGRGADGRRYLDFAVQGGENNVAVAQWHTYLAEACLREGQLDVAQSVIDRAIELAERRRERGFLAHAQRVAADVAGRRGDARRARRLYEDAIALATAQGMAPLRTECERALGDLTGRLDDPGADDPPRPAEAPAPAEHVRTPDIDPAPQHR
jgi:transcriptional regulator with AAA-type ATPase domain/tetratricopeptide (TPR) repeat protein